MGLFSRKAKLPPADRPPLRADERVLAWAAVGNGEGDGVVVASNLGLWLPGRGERIGWHDVLKAVWSGRELTVTPADRVAERDGYLVVADCPAETYLLLDPGELPHQVRARVTRSVEHSCAPEIQACFAPHCRVRDDTAYGELVVEPLAVAFDVLEPTLLGDGDGLRLGLRVRRRGVDRLLRRCCRRRALISGLAARAARGEGERKRVQLVALAGERRVYGGNGWIDGPLDEAGKQQALGKLR